MTFNLFYDSMMSEYSVIMLTSYILAMFLNADLCHMHVRMKVTYHAL